jgi:hypothetical protein
MLFNSYLILSPKEKCVGYIAPKRLLWIGCKRESIAQICMLRGDEKTALN